MASATSVVSNSAARKSILPTASLFKAVAPPAKEASSGTAAGAGNSEQTPPHFADALKFARRQATPEPKKSTGHDHPKLKDYHDQKHKEDAPEVDEDRQPEARDTRRARTEHHKDPASKSRRSEKTARRRDHNDAASEAPGKSTEDDLPTAEETDVVSDDQPLPADPEESIPTADADVPAQLSPEQLAALLQQLAIPQEAAQQPVTAEVPEPAETPETTPETKASAPASTPAPVAKPIVTQSPAPEETLPTSEEVEPTKTAKADTKAIASRDKKPVAPIQPTESPEPTTDSAPASELANAKPAHPLHPDHPVHPDHPQHPEHFADAPKQATPNPATPILQPLQRLDVSALPTAPDTAPEQEPTKPATAIQPIVTTATVAAPARLEESADAAQAAQETPALDADQTFEQVVAGLRGKLDARTGKAEIRLEPPNLGPLHVSLHLQNGSLTAQFQSSSDVVRDLLKSNMEKLKGVLESQGITVDKLAVGAVESPADKAVMQPSKLPNSGAPNNDGRSAGQYHREQNAGQKRSNGNGFGKVWRDATAEAPIDLVG